MRKEVPGRLIKFTHIVHNIHMPIEIAMPRVDCSSISFEFCHNFDWILKFLRDGHINVARSSIESFEISLQYVNIGRWHT